MRKVVLLTAAIILFAATFTLAEAQEDKKLDVTFDLTYTSKYMSKGSESYGQQPRLMETVYFDLWGTGFGVAFGHQGSTSSGYVEKQRFNYKVYYGSSIFDGTPYKTKYKFSWEYKNYYGRARNKGNSQEWISSLSWPEILPVENLAPYYIVHYEHPSGSGYNNYKNSGWAHRFGLGYDLTVPELSNPLRLSAEIVYRDGLGGPTKDHDWSHATFGIATNLKLNDRLSFVPGLYYQESMDDSVCKRDVIYCKLSLKYRF